MPDELLSKVQRATTLDDRYCRAAGYTSMNVYLDDWCAAYERLGRAIERLRALRDQRVAEVERGEWPPARASKGAS